MPRHVTTRVDVEVHMMRSVQERRGGEAKVLVSLNSPADVEKAIIFVIILTSCKTTNKTLIRLQQASVSFTVSLQQEEKKKRGGSEMA